VIWSESLILVYAKSKAEWMGMTNSDDATQVDSADMEDSTHFRDEKCQQLEEILEKDTKFKGCIVTRTRLQKESSELKDPFDIQSSDGTHLAWFHEREFDFLDKPKIAPYLDVQRKREQRLNSYRSWELLGHITGLIGVVGVIILLLSLFLGITQELAFILLSFGVITLWIGCTAIPITSIRKQAALARLDRESARENPLFLDALRTLAALSGAENRGKDSYMVRLQRVEPRLMDGH
jgi:hypothetical protein